MDDRDKKTELLVGLFLLVGMVMMGLLILQFGAVREVFKGTYHLRVAFPDAAGIRDGSPVVLGGARVGNVKDKPVLNDTFTGVIIDLEIFEGVQIPADAKFQIGTAGLMGDSYIEIKPSGKITSDFLPTNLDKVIQGSRGSGLTDLSQTADQIGKKVDVVLDDLRTAIADVRGAVNRVKDGALSQNTITDFNESIEHLNSTMKRVDERVLGDENTTNLKSAITDIKEAAASFKTSAKNVEEQTKRLGPMLDKLDPALAKVDSVVSTADDALKSVKRGADSFAETMEKLRSGKGLLQALMSDAELKDDFKDLISNLKRKGFLFYRDAAAKEEAESEEESRRHSPLLYGRPRGSR